MPDAQSCPVPAADWSALDGTFDEVKEKLGAHSTWVRFFGVRPCCPAPGADAARGRIAELKERIAQKPGLTGAQQAELFGIADGRLAWYLKSFNVKG